MKYLSNEYLMNILLLYIYRYLVGASGQLQQRPHRTSPQATQVVAQIGSDCNSNVFPWPWLISLNASRHCTAAIVSSG